MPKARAVYCRAYMAHILGQLQYGCRMYGRKLAILARAVSTSLEIQDGHSALAVLWTVVDQNRTHAIRAKTIGVARP
jgi:hypothetical protein